MGKFFLVGVSLAFLLLSANLAAAETIDLELREQLAAAIRAHGYICRTCEGGREWSHPNQGKLMQVYCNRNSVAYRMVLTASQKVSCVEPWSEEGQKCK